MKARHAPSHDAGVQLHTDGSVQPWGDTSSERETRLMYECAQADAHAARAQRHTAAGLPACLPAFARAHTAITIAR